MENITKQSENLETMKVSANQEVSNNSNVKRKILREGGG